MIRKRRRRELDPNQNQSPTHTHEDIHLWPKRNELLKTIIIPKMALTQ
jgi:hypothetical protein